MSNAKIIRAHYDQLKIFYEAPHYLKDLMAEKPMEKDSTDSSSSSDMFCGFPEVGDDVECIPDVEDISRKLAESKPEVNASQHSEQLLYKEKPSEILNSAQLAPGDNLVGETINTESLFKSISSLVLRLEEDRNSKNKEESQTSGQNMSLFEPVNKILDRLKFKEVPLSMLHCSELANYSPGINVAASTPHPSMQRRAQFWTLSSGGSCLENSISNPKRLMQSVRENFIQNEADLRELIGFITQNEHHWSVASDIIAELDSSIEYATAVQDNGEKRSSESFTGFSSGDKETQRTSLRALETLKSVIAESDNNRRKLEETGITNRLKSSLEVSQSSEQDSMCLKRVTRSTGKPLELPNVQKHILERKRKNRTVSM